MPTISRTHGPLPVGHMDPLPDRVLVGKLLPRHRLVDQEHRHAVFTVQIGKEPAPTQGDAHRLEVAWRDDVMVR